MQEIDNYEYLITVRENLLQRKRSLEKRISDTENAVERFSFAIDMIGKQYIDFGLSDFIDNLSLATGVSKDDINVSMNSLESTFDIYYSSDVMNFSYSIDYPEDWDVLADSDLICSMSISDIVKMSDGSDDHPKDIFKTCVMESAVSEKSYSKKIK